MTLDTLTHLLALAARLEGEGQYNNGKLLRAAADSLLARAARQLDLPTEKVTLLAETDQAIASLSALNIGAELMSALNQERAAGHCGKPSPICATRRVCSPSGLTSSLITRIRFLNPKPCLNGRRKS